MFFRILRTRSLGAYETFPCKTGEQELNWSEQHRFWVLLSLCIMESLHPSRGRVNLNLPLMGKTEILPGCGRHQASEIRQFPCFSSMSFPLSSETVVPLRLQNHWNANFSEVQKCTCFLLHTHDIWQYFHLPRCPCECLKRYYFSLLFTIEIQISERTHQFSSLIPGWKH